MSSPEPFAAVRLPERLATAGIIAATTTGATFAILLAGGFGQVDLRLVFDGLAVVAVVPWLTVATLRQSWLPSSRLMPAIVACLAAFAVSTLTSRVPRLSLEMLGYAVLLTELYLLLVALMRRPRLRAHFARLALVLCVVVCVLYLLQVFLLWQQWWSLVGRLAVPPLRPAYVGFNLGSPNPVAALVLLLLGFVLAAVDLGTPAARVAGALLVLVVVAVVLLTGSRGAWLGAAVALALTGAGGIALIPGVRGRAIHLVRSRIGLSAVVGLLLFLGGAAVLAARSGRLSLDDEGRNAFAAVSLRIFRELPLTGTGPGTWQILRAANTTAAQVDVYVPHAHSIYWQALAEFGMLGVAAGGVVAISLALLIIGGLHSADPSRRRMAFAALFVVVYLAVHQTVDMFMNIPSILLALALPLAWLDAAASDAGNERPRAAWPRIGVPPMIHQRVVPLVMVVVTCTIAFGLFRAESVTSVDVRAVSAADSGHWSDAARLAAQAAAADPELAAYQFTLGVASANAGDLPLAESALAKGANTDDYTYAWLDLAAVRWRLGDAAGALAALSSAERLGLQRATVGLPAGWLRQQLGDRQGAVRDYVDALAGAPTLSSDPFWSSSSSLREIWPSVWTTAQEELTGPTLLQLDLAAGRLDLARQVAVTLAPGNPALYGLVVPAWEGDARSWSALQQLAAAHPLDGTAVAWCELVAGRRRDQAAIARYRTWAEIDNSPAVLPPFARVTMVTAQTVPPSVFDDYELLYRRPVPADQIVTILPQITWQSQP